MKDTIPVRKGEELNIVELDRYISKNIAGISDGALEVEQFSAGHSNLTYLLRKGEWEAVLRRPPLGPVAPKAHDMEREYRILRELNPAFPTAPKPYVYNDDVTIIGSPFFIMERRRGVVLDTEFPTGVKVTEGLCKTISETMVDTLVKLHQLDYKETSLTEISQPDGFLERQVHGWISRYERAKTDDIEGVERLKKWMVTNLPKSLAPTVIHYDFKLNNAMFSSDDFTKMVGLFDWEMTTVGDPLADLGAAMSYWITDNDPKPLKYGMGKPPVTVMPGFISRNEFVEAYAKKSGRDVSQFHYYLTFAYFKLAVICQQIYYRWKKGQTKDERFSKLNYFVDLLIQHALTVSEDRTFKV